MVSLRQSVGEFGQQDWFKAPSCKLMLLFLLLHGAKLGDMTLVDSFLSITHHKFDGKAQRQTSNGVMVDPRLFRLCPGECNVCG